MIRTVPDRRAAPLLPAGAARWALALASAALLACVPEEGPLMRPGQDCMECHGGGGRGGREGGEGEDEEARPWTVAGTVYLSPSAPARAGVEGANVEVTDASGFGFSLRSNQVGNFYVADALAFPLRVCVERGGARRCMEAPITAADGSCNRCHAYPLPAGVDPETAGRLTAP